MTFPALLMSVIKIQTRKWWQKMRKSRRITNHVYHVTNCSLKTRNKVQLPLEKVKKITFPVTFPALQRSVIKIRK